VNTLVSNAAIALRPIDAVRDRLASGSLKVGPTLATLVVVLFACNALLFQAQTFFWDAWAVGGGGKNPLTGHPLLSDFARYMSLAATTFAPLGSVALLPRAVFMPIGREAVMSAVFVTLTASSFYTLMAFGLAYYVGGLVVLVQPPELLLDYLPNPHSLVAVVLALFAIIWLCVAVRVLDLSWFSTLVVGTVFCGMSWGIYWLYFEYVSTALRA